MYVVVVFIIIIVITLSSPLIIISLHDAQRGLGGVLPGLRNDTLQKSLQNDTPPICLLDPGPRCARKKTWLSINRLIHRSIVIINHLALTIFMMMKMIDIIIIASVSVMMMIVAINAITLIFSTDDDDDDGDDHGDDDDDAHDDDDDDASKTACT